MPGGRFRSKAWIVALIFFLAGLAYLVRPVYISTASADETAASAVTGTGAQSSGDVTGSGSGQQSESKASNWLGLSLPKITLPKLEWKLPDSSFHSDHDSENSTEGNINCPGENPTDTGSSSSETSSGDSGATAVEETRTPAVVDDLLNDTVIGSVENSTFPYQMDMGDLVIETDNLMGDSFTSSQVAMESSQSLKGQVANIFGTNWSRSSLARLNWRWAMFNRFKIYQNLSAPNVEPCHIEYGSDAPVQVSAQNFSVDTSEIYAGNLSDGSTFYIGKYWTINPAMDLPRRYKGKGLAMLNGNNMKIKAHTIKAQSISIPNLSITVEPGLKMSTVD